MLAFLPTVVLSLAVAQTGFAGPIAYATCQAGCSTAAVSCYAAAGFV